MSLMASKIDAIVNVNSSKDDWSIVARVVRLWSVVMGKRSRTTSIEMILADRDGSRIQATVRQNFIKNLKEGCVYSFKGFSVCANGGEYCATKHEYKINFNGSTKVVLLADNVVPLPAYAFAPFPEILEGLHDSSYLIDVLGILTGVGEEKSINRSTGVTKMNVIELENRGVKITCAQWGLYVDQLNTFTATSGTDTVIVALFGVKKKEFQGKRSLQNAMHCAKLVFNPQFSEAIELRRCVNSDVTFSQRLNHLTSSGMPSLADDFLTLTEGKNIAQLMDLQDDTTGCFIVLGTIHHIADPLDWWYLACKCHGAVYPESVAYYCNFCHRRVLHVTARYKLKVNVVDETGSTTFVIFDRPASILFNKECSDMIASFEKDDNGSDCPPVISDLVNKQFLFKVEVKGQTSANFEPTYIVKRLTDDPAIMNKFKEINGADELILTEHESSSRTHCHEPVVDNDIETLLLQSPLEGAASSTAKQPNDDSLYLNKKGSTGKQIASEDCAILDRKFNPKLLKRIKIEKP